MFRTGAIERRQIYGLCNGRTWCQAHRGVICDIMDVNEPHEDHNRRKIRRRILGVAVVAPLAVISTLFLRPPHRASRQRRIVCRSSEVGTEQRVLSVGDKRMCIRRDAEGTLVAYDMACTHAGCLVEVTKAGFSCPCHGGRFMPDGTPAGGPVRRPLRSIQVHDIEGMVVATLE